VPQSPSAAEAGTENKPVIAAVNRCATQKQNRVFQQTASGTTVFSLVQLAGPVLAGRGRPALHHEVRSVPEITGVTSRPDSPLHATTTLEQGYYNHHHGKGGGMVMKTLLTLLCLAGGVCFAQQNSPQDMKGMNMPGHDMSQMEGT